MFLRKKLKNGSPVVIVAPVKTKERLAYTGFRGKDQKLAGNFQIWVSVYDVFRDPFVTEEFLESLSYSLRKEEISLKHSVTIYYGSLVGWSSTDQIDAYQSVDLESFNPNRRSSGVRVKAVRNDLLSPLTNKLTIVFDLKIDRGLPTAIIHSVLPRGRCRRALGRRERSRRRRVLRLEPPRRLVTHCSHKLHKPGLAMRETGSSLFKKLFHPVSPTATLPPQLPLFCFLYG